MAIEIIGHQSQGLALRGVVLKALGDHSDYVVRTACGAVARWELIEAHEGVVALLGERLEILCPFASLTTSQLVRMMWPIRHVGQITCAILTLQSCPAATNKSVKPAPNG